MKKNDVADKERRIAIMLCVQCGKLIPHESRAGITYVRNTERDYTNAEDPMDGIHHWCTDEGGGELFLFAELNPALSGTFTLSAPTPEAP